MNDLHVHIGTYDQTNFPYMQTPCAKSKSTNLLEMPIVVWSS